MDERDIEDTFGKFGRIESVWIARKPPGFAFVTYDDSRDAEDAVRELDGKELDRERLTDAYQRIRCEISRSGGGGKGGGGGGGKGGQERRPGDWDCPSCGAMVFAAKDSCFKCGTPKPRDGGGGGRYGDDRRDDRGYDDRGRDDRRDDRRGRSRSRSRSRGRDRSRSRSGGRY